MMRVLSIVVCIALFQTTSVLAQVDSFTINAHARLAWRTEFSPDGKWLATSAKDEAPKLWNLSDPATRDIRTQAPAHVLGKETFGALAFDFSPDGKAVIVGTADGKLRSFAVADAQERFVVALEGQISDGEFSPDGKWIATVHHQSRQICVLDSTTGEVLRKLQAPMLAPPTGSQGIGQIAFTPDGEFLVAACGGRGWPNYSGEDSQITIWRTKDWSLHARFVADPYNINALAISPDSKLIAASCHKSCCVKVWRIPSPDVSELPRGHEVERLIKETGHKDVKIREAAERKLLQYGKAEFERLITVMKEGTPEQQLRATVILILLAEEKLDPEQVLEGKNDRQSVAFSPDGKWLATGGGLPAKNNVTFYRLPKMLLAYDLPTESGAWNLQFSADGKQFSHGKQDGTVTVWRSELSLPK